MNSRSREEYLDAAGQVRHGDSAARNHHLSAIDAIVKSSFRCILAVFMTFATRGWYDIKNKNDIQGLGI
jgi:hypothetical protein